MSVECADLIIEFIQVLRQILVAMVVHIDYLFSKSSKAHLGLFHSDGHRLIKSGLQKFFKRKRFIRVKVQCIYDQIFEQPFPEKTKSQLIVFSF